MEKIQTEDERRKSIADRIIDEYIRERFEGFYPGGTAIIIPVLDADKLRRKILAAVEKQ